MRWFPCFLKICAEEGGSAVNSVLKDLRWSPLAFCAHARTGILQSSHLARPADNAKGKKHGKRKEVTFNPGKKLYLPDVSFSFESPGGIHV